MSDLYKNMEEQDPLDYTDLVKDYSSQWIIISEDNSKVIAHGNTPEEIMAYKDQGVIMKVPDNDKFPAL
jgi:hypothetical protein